MSGELRRFLRRVRRERVGSGSESKTSLGIEQLDTERGFRFTGDLDVFSAADVRTALEPELHGTLVLDLAGVEFMDDSGFGLLVWAHKRLRERDGSLVLRNPRGRILRTFEVAGIAAIPGLTIEPDEDRDS